MKTDLNPLLGKQDNVDGNSGKVNANEWNTLVGAVQENQASVMSISYNNGAKLRPDENGNVNIVITENNYLLNIKVVSLTGSMPYKVALGNSFLLQMDVSNKYVEGDEQISVSTSCSAKYYVNGIVVKETDVYDNQTYVEDLGSHLSEGKNTIKIVVDNHYGNIKESMTYEVTAIYLSIELPSFNQLIPVTGESWELAVRIVGSNANVHLFIDNIGGLVGSQTAGSTNPYIITEGLTHGVHTLEVYATSEEDSKIKTESIIKEYFYVVDGNATTLIGTSFKSGSEINMYNVLEIPYWIFSFDYNGAKDVNIKILGDTDDDVLYETTQSIAVINGLSELSYLQYPLYNESLIGDRRVRITVDTAFRDIRVLIMANKAILQEVSGYDLKLNSAGRSNKDINYNDWSYGQYKIEFPDTFEFADFGSGWNKDTDGNVALHIKRGKRVSLNYKPFAENPAFGNDSDVTGTKTGLTISLEFATRNCVYRDAEVIKCTYNGVGFIIKANSLEFASNSESLSADFKEDTHIRVDLVIEGNPIRYIYEDNGETKTSDEARMLVYVDGVYQQMKLISNTTSFKQVVAQEIVFGSDYCDLDLYCVRAYRTALNMKAITDNYSFDTPIVDEKIKIAIRNNVFDSNLNVAYNLLSIARPELPIMLLGIETLPSSKDKIPIANTTFTNPNNPDDYDAGAASFTSSNDEIGNQGTSSLNYPMPYRNFDQKFSGESIIVNGVKYTKYITYPGMPGAKSFTYKKDYASSEMCNNVIMSMIYTEMGYGIRNNFPNVLTLAQQNLGLQYRQSLYGFPFFIFKYWDNQYTPMGMFNFINYKNDEKYLGFTGNYTWEKSRAQCWEIRDNNVFWDTIYEEARWDAEAGKEKNDIFTYYEGRYPKDSTYNEDNDFGHASIESEIPGAIDETRDLLRFHNWLVSTNQANATGALLNERYTDKNGMIHTYDNAAYRRAKFITEQEDYIILDQWILYYIWRETFWMYDSGSKNLDLYTMDGVHWGCMVRDCDTAMGIDNEGRFMFPPYLEDKDYIVNNNFVYDKSSMPEGGRTVLNGQRGTMWVNIRDCFGDRIQKMFVELYSQSANSKFSYANVIKMCEDHQSKWSEALYNFGQKQYSGGAIYSKWISSGLGDKKNQRRFWLYYGFRYRMSKYHAGSTVNRITWRQFGTGSNLNIKTYTQMYVSLGFGTYDYDTTKRYRCTNLEEGVTVLNEFTQRVDDVVMYMFNGDLITDLGNLYEFGDIGSLDLTNAVRLRFLRIGNHNKVSSYLNQRLTDLNLTTCVALEYLDLSNCQGFGTQTGQNGVFTLNLEKQTALRELYCKGSTITNITFPETETLTTAHLGGKLKKLRLVNLPGLTDFTMEGGNYLESIVIKNTGAANTYNIVYEAWATGTNQLTEVDIEDVNWDNCSVDFINYIASINGKLTGKIKIADSETVTFETKKRWIELWGAVDNNNNNLYITYPTINIQKLEISGETALYEIGSYQMTAVSTPTTGNNILDLVWSISANNYATIDEVSGLVTVHSLPASGLTPTAIVTLTANKLNGSKLVASISVNFYKPNAKFGDYVYHDGTYNTSLNTFKDVVGIVLDVDETGQHGWCCSLQSSEPECLYESKASYGKYAGLTESATVDGSVTRLQNMSINSFKSLLLNDDGSFKTFTSGCLSINALNNTNMLINYAKKIVIDKGRIYPTTIDEYNQYKIDYGSEYTEVCPRALLSTFYEPNTDKILNDKFKKGNWVNIDLRLLCRIVILYGNQYECYLKNIIKIPLQTPIASITLGGKNSYSEESYSGIMIPNSLTNSNGHIQGGFSDRVYVNYQSYITFYVCNF